MPASNPQDTLTKAIQRAYENGWRSPMYANQIPVVMEGVDYTNLIYNHDFSKALWGDKFINPTHLDDTGSTVISFKQTAWKHHLREMVTSADPIKYLGENI